MSTLRPMSGPGRFGPLSEGHGGVGLECSLCRYPMRVGDVPALVEAEDRDHDGITRECLMVHERCLYGSLT